MAIFKYKAINQDNRTVQGMVEAVNISLAERILRDRNYSIISLKEKKTISIEFSLPFFNQVKTKDLVVFSRQFAVMISANVSLVQALSIITEQTVSPKLKKIVSEITDEVDSGSRLSEALEKRPKVFSDFYTSVIKSGETSGKLDEVLNYLADEMEKDFDMTSKIKTAMIYPVVLLTVLFGVGIFMMVSVIPKLTAIITESGVATPLPTLILMSISDFLIAYWWLLIIVIIVLIIGIRFYIKTSMGKRNVDFLKLKLPVFGHLFQLIYIVRFTRSMNTLLVGGVTISKSLEIAADVVDNEIYKDLILKTIEEVEEGNSISSVFSTSNHIPQMVSQMMSVGEKTGKLDLILEKITSFYTREINNIISNLMTLMEPIIIVLMGAAVATVVFAVILPMYSMVQAY